MTTPDTSPAPTDVAHRWATAMRGRESDQLAALYEVGAALHVGGDIVLGPDNIAATLLALPTLPEAEPTIDVGDQGLVTLNWGATSDGDGDSARLRIRHGQIVEQWIGGRTITTAGLAATPMELSTSGDLSDDDYDLVWDMLDHVVKLRDEKVIHVDARLEQHPGQLEHQPEQRGPDPVALRVTIRLVGGSIRASTHAADVRVAVQIVQRRLTEALHRRAERRSDSRRGTTHPASTDANSSFPTGYFQRPPAEREIVRHKSVSPGPSTLEEATFDLLSMGYDFFLYIDVESGDDALVARDGDGSFAEHRDPPIMSKTLARERLDEGNEPFVFFRHPDTGRGNVLYRRRDGHYGLIVPSDA